MAFYFLGTYLYAVSLQKEFLAVENKRPRRVIKVRAKETRERREHALFSQVATKGTWKCDKIRGTEWQGGAGPAFRGRLFLTGFRSGLNWAPHPNWVCVLAFDERPWIRTVRTEH